MTGVLSQCSCQSCASEKKVIKDREHHHVVSIRLQQLFILDIEKGICPGRPGQFLFKRPGKVNSAVVKVCWTKLTNNNKKESFQFSRVSKSA